MRATIERSVPHEKSPSHKPVTGNRSGLDEASSRAHSRRICLRRVRRSRMRHQRELPHPRLCVAAGVEALRPALPVRSRRSALPTEEWFRSGRTHLRRDGRRRARSRLGGPLASASNQAKNQGDVTSEARPCQNALTESPASVGLVLRDRSSRSQDLGMQGSATKSKVHSRGLAFLCGSVFGLLGFGLGLGLVEPTARCAGIPMGPCPSYLILFLMPVPIAGLILGILAGIGCARAVELAAPARRSSAAAKDVDSDRAGS